MLSWEPAISRLLHLIRLDSIKGKILVFALLATTIPALAMGWQSYVLNRRFMTEKIAEELRNATSHTVREFDLWLKERFYEVRVFSSSYEVSENLERLGRAGGPGGAPDARRRLGDYLKSVRARFVDYEELLVVGGAGDVLSTSAEETGAPHLPADWLRQAQADAIIVGDPYWDEARGKGVMVIAVPIRAANGSFLGVMAGKLNFGTVERLLKSFSLGTTGQVYLVTGAGTVIVSSRPTGVPFPEARLPAGTATALFAREDGDSLEYVSPGGSPVRGGLKRLPTLGWGVVAEIGQAEAYRQTVQVLNLTLAMVFGLLGVIGLTAYFLALTIARPLDRLTAGATTVAAGDLDVDLPVVDHGEVGYLTQVFNYMVTRLRESRDQLAAINVALSQKNEELRERSITDGLTGLYNRKHLGETLATEAARAARLKHPFSVMMIDIDHFKRYNDTHGHLAGDRLLTRIAVLFREMTRSIDYAARYGGEEFLLMLPEVGAQGALVAAERIRRRVAAERFEPEPQPVTVSIGVAAFPEHGETPEAIIAAADAALYEAKRGGRDRVVLAAGSQAAA